MIKISLFIKRFWTFRVQSCLIPAIGLTVSLLTSCVANQQLSETQPLASQTAPSQTAPAQTVPAQNSPESLSVLIPAGNYTIGSNAADDAQSVHTVALPAFQIDRYEVTNAQYAEFLNSLKLQPLQDAAAGAVRASDLPQASLFIEGSEGHQQSPLLIALDDEHSRIAIQNSRFVAQPGYEQHPVTETTWRGARQFCEWRGARLPTEAEWEAAARGLEGRTYPWGNQPPTPERAVYGRNSGQTAAVGTHPAGATPEGIQDLAGNVAEWTSSLYQPYPYNPGDGREDPAQNGERVTRGGDHVFDSDPSQLTADYRTGFSREPDRGHRHIGFRCAQSIP